MRKLLFVLSLLFVADVCSVDAQQALLIRKKDKSRVGFPVSRIDAVKIASVDTLPESMFKNDTTYQYKTIRVSNIPSSVPSYTYTGAHIGLENQYAIAQTATAIPAGNSAAVYNGYMFVVADKLASVTLYDMRQNKQLAVCNLEPREDVDDSQSTVYSCAYASFGTLKYSTYDEFPLLYVSQRAKTGGKCFVTVLRVVPVMNANLTSCTSFSVQQVQTITLPAATTSNGLYEAKLAVNPQTGDFYVYSYNPNDATGQLRISQFAAVSLSKTEVTLASPKSSYLLTNLESEAIKGAAVRGGFISQDRFYLAEESADSGILHVVDLVNKKTVSSLSLKTADVTVKPHMCLNFKNHITLISEDNNLYTIYIN